MKTKNELDPETDKLLKNILIACDKVLKKHGKKKPSKDIRGSMKCPICKKGTLGYGISSYNGHTHGRCSDQKCINWVE